MIYPAMIATHAIFFFSPAVLWIFIMWRQEKHAMCKAIATCLQDIFPVQKCGGMPGVGVALAGKRFVHKILLRYRKHQFSLCLICNLLLC